jgi:hypothetical protein
MDVKDAVKMAKKYIDELFAEEGVAELGLEEVEYDDLQNEWRITVGFSRPWERERGGLLALTQGHVQKPRSYKVVRVSAETGTALSVKNRVN